MMAIDLEAQSDDDQRCWLRRQSSLTGALGDLIRRFRTLMFSPISSVEELHFCGISCTLIVLYFIMVAPRPAPETMTLLQQGAYALFLMGAAMGMVSYAFAHTILGMGKTRIHRIRPGRVLKTCMFYLFFAVLMFVGDVILKKSCPDTR